MSKMCGPDCVLDWPNHRLLSRGSALAACVAASPKRPTSMASFWSNTLPDATTARIITALLLSSKSYQSVFWRAKERNPTAPPLGLDSSCFKPWLCISFMTFKATPLCAPLRCCSCIQLYCSTVSSSRKEEKPFASRRLVSTSILATSPGSANAMNPCAPPDGLGVLFGNSFKTWTLSCLGVEGELDAKASTSSRHMMLCRKPWGTPVDSPTLPGSDPPST
mmetsp:Transcript_10596/g.26720  ORF Transcript_10596/g.26720 Transcript_10596/m.26720 type:complete len:221 (-) Transcript_10596:314-976(-)